MSRRATIGRRCTTTSTPGISGDNASLVKGSSTTPDISTRGGFSSGQPQPLACRAILQETAPLGKGVGTGEVAQPEVRPQDRFVELGESPIACADGTMRGDCVGMVPDDVRGQGEDVARFVHPRPALKREVGLRAGARRSLPRARPPRLNRSRSSQVRAGVAPACRPPTRRRARAAAAPTRESVE